MKNGTRTHRHLLPNSRMNICVLDHQPFLVRDKEVTSMRYWIRLRWCRYTFAASGIKMCVKMNDGDGTIEFIEGTKNGKDDCVIATESIMVLCCTLVIVRDMVMMGRREAIV